MTTGALAAFPLRSDWEQAELDRRYPAGRPYRYPNGAETYREIFLAMLAESDPFPAPVATTRDGHVPPVIPAPVATLVAAVQRQGWATLVQHSEGHVPHATHGRPGVAPVVHWAVRMHKSARGAVAVRKGAAWEFFYVWSAAGFGRAITVAHFQDILRFGPWLSATVLGPEDCPWLVKWQGPMPSTAEQRWGALA